MRVLCVAAFATLSGCCWPAATESSSWVCPGGGTVDAEVDATFDVGGQVCATIGQQTCAQAIEVPPELVGRWAFDIRTHWLLDATLVEIRDDGYAWVRYYEGPPAAQGQIRFRERDAVLQMCGDPAVLPITVRDKAIEWEGSTMSRVDDLWYEDLTEEELRRLEELSRGLPGEVDWEE